MRFFLFLIVLLPGSLLAQDDDYYTPEKTRKEITTELKDLHRWGPKLGLEIHASVDYNHLLMPMSIAGSFERAFGGIGLDAGGGIRIRAYHKLAFAGGFNYAIRSFNLKYEAEEATTGDLLKVTEKATMHFMGFYYKTLIELSRKLHLAQTFQYTWIRQYKGTVSAENLTNPASFLPPTAITQPVLDGWSAAKNQAEIGIELAYKWMIAPELIFKPYIGISFAVTPAIHTDIYLDGFFGPEEQNPRYVSLKLGVILETGLWLDRLKDQ